MKQHGWTAASVSLLVLCAGPASAQASKASDKVSPLQAAYEEALKAAQAKVSATEPGAQLSLIYSECERTVEMREAMPARVWCATAVDVAVKTLDRAGGPSPGVALDTVRRGLWLDAFDGLMAQKNPWYGSPRVETISIGDRPRGSAYTLFAVINRGEPTLPAFRFEGLARVLGAERAPKETLGSLRRRAFERLDALTAEQAKPSTALMWGYAAVGLSTSIPDSKSDFKAEGAATAARLAGKADLAEPLKGEDAVLAPALRLAEGWSLYMAEDYPAALATLQKGAEECPARIWQDAVLCNQLNKVLELVRKKAAKAPA